MQKVLLLIGTKIRFIDVEGRIYDGKVVGVDNFGKIKLSIVIDLPLATRTMFVFADDERIILSGQTS